MRTCARANIQKQAHPIGWDKQERVYYELSNRLYRRTDPAIPEPITKSKTKLKYTSKKAAALRRRERSSKRRKVAQDSDDDTEMNDVDDTMNDTQMEYNGDDSKIEADPTEVNTFGDYKWECIAVTLDDFKTFTASIAKSRDENERNLKDKIEDDMIPELEKVEERRQRRTEAKLREIQMQEKMQGAKRSGRLAAKQEREREEAEAAEAEKQRQVLLEAARRDEERQQQLDDDRRSRMLTREQRIREREYKRILMEEQLAKDAEEQERVEQEGARGSRHLKERIEKNKKELEELEEEDWTFDCSGCGRYGKNFDDGQHSIACERCNVWQHSKCLGFTKSAAERDDFHFVCDDCRRKEEEANRPKISLKFKLNQSSSPPQPRHEPPQESSRTAERLVSVDVPLSNVPIQSRVLAPAVNGESRQMFDQAQASSLPFQPTQAHGQQPSMYPYSGRQLQQPFAHRVGGQQSGHVNAAGHVPYAYPGQLPDTQARQVLPRQPSNTQQMQQNQPVLPPQMQPSSSHARSSPPPASNHSQMNGSSSPIRQRIPSPMINKPTMSPTQGNPEVGRIVGFPGSSPSLPPAALATPHTNGTHTATYTNGTNPQATPNQQVLAQNASFSASQSGNQMSGLSPTKQRVSASPLPTPTLVPRKSGSFTTPSSSFQNASNIRSVSGTPIFPPVENLAPSPHQLNREPVPTPSKQSIPSPPPLADNSSSQQTPSFDNAAARATVDRNMTTNEQNERYSQQQQQSAVQ